MLVIIYIILLILVIAALVIWGKKIPWLSSKITFMGLLVFLIITGLLFVRVMYKVKSAPTVTEQTKNLEQDKAQQEYLAKDTDNYIKKTTIIVGVTTNFYPWVYKNKNTVTGFNIDLVKQAVNLMAKKIKIKVYPNKEALFNALNNKEIDIIADLSPVYINSDNKYAYSLRITDPPFVFIAKKSLTKSLNNNKDLSALVDAVQNKTIAIPNASFFKIYIANLLKENAKIVTLNTSAEVIEGVVKGKYQVGFTEYFSFLQYLKTHPKSKLGVFHPLLSSNLNEGFAFVLNNQDLELKKQLDIALTLLKRRGTMSNISIKYFKEDVTL